MSQTEEKKGIGRRVQAFGSFLSSMIMPNIGAFIAWRFHRLGFYRGHFYR